MDGIWQSLPMALSAKATFPSIQSRKNVTLPPSNFLYDAYPNPETHGFVYCRISQALRLNHSFLSISVLFYYAHGFQRFFSNMAFHDTQASSPHFVYNSSIIQLYCANDWTDTLQAQTLDSTSSPSIRWS